MEKLRHGEMKWELKIEGREKRVGNEIGMRDGNRYENKDWE